MTRASVSVQISVKRRGERRKRRAARPAFRARRGVPTIAATVVAAAAAAAVAVDGDPSSAPLVVASVEQ